MPLLLPPFGRGGGGSGLPPRLQNQQQDTEVSTGVNKRPAHLPHAPGGRGIRLNWNRQPPGYNTNGMGPRDRRLDSPEPGFSGSRKLERMSSKGSSNSSTDGEMPMPSGCPLPTGAFTAPPPPPPPAPPVPPGPLHNSMAPSPFLFPPPTTVSQTQVPFSPYLVVPHVDNSAPINVNAKSSSDPKGTDLPMNDIATLRFFFNLGLEYYRLCMLFQLQQQQQYAAYLGSQQMAAAAAAGPVPPLDGAIYVGDLEDIQGQSSSKEGPSNSDKTVPKDKQKQKSEKVAAEKPAEPEVVSKGGSAEKSATVGTVESAAKGKKETVDVKDSDSKVKVGQSLHCEDTAVDSGCASDVSTDGSPVTDECFDASRVPCLFDNHSDNSDSQSNLPADSHSDSSSQHSTSNLSVLSSSSGSDCSSVSSLPFQKPYYTPLRSRSSPKLMKPLKDIPPRFQKMLSCNPAIRQDQFEGQPIMRQAFHGNGHHHHKPKSVVVSANNLNDLPTYHSFNPHAESFVPRQSVSTNPCSSTNSSSCTRSNSSSSMYSTCPTSSDMTGVPPSECCSTSSSESGSAGVGDGSVVSWTAPPPTSQNVPAASGPIAPTYTIHIHSAGCTIEPAAGVCSLSGNHCLSAATPAGSYAVSNALPAAPANTTYITQDPSAAAAHSIVPAAAPVATGAPAPPPPAPPGGIVYYCQQQQQPQPQQHPESYTYSATTYTLPAPQATSQYVYTAPATGYQTYDNYAYS